jgi:hypothetical protein
MANKGAGRPKGSPNKRSVEFREKLEALQKKHGFDLVELMTAQALGTDETMYAGMEPQDKAPFMNSARKTLQEYAYPKLKSMEVQNVEPVRIILVDHELDQCEDLLE